MTWRVLPGTITSRSSGLSIADRVAAGAAGAARFCGTPARIDKALLIYNNSRARKWRNWQTRQT